MLYGKRGGLCRCKRYENYYYKNNILLKYQYL